ncbi:hypothetical protein IT396_01570 [Candidatus Nomurabacteria bacterium]|nr:hypothetical protein [Candidatus Nomurabacteria bacterium]
MTRYNHFVRNSTIALLAFMALALPTAFVQADFGDDIGVWDMGGGYDYYPDTYTDYYPDTYTDYYPDTYTDYYQDSYSDYYTAPSYSSGYSSGGSYSYPSYSSGYSYGSSYSTPSYSVPSYSYSNTNVETCNATNSCNDNSVEDNDTYEDNDTHTETCSATNSCNDNSNHSYDYTSNYTSTWTDNSVHDYSSTWIDNSVFHSDDHSVVNIQNPAPQPYIVYKDRERDRDRDRDDDRHYDRDYDVCYNLPGFQDYVPNGYYVSGGNCFYQQYNTPAPYVSLSAVPYTGLEMGPTAAALYWGFLVLWCAVAAYLIAVKKVQNKLVNGLNTFLFPATAHTSSHAQVSVSETKEVAKTNTDGIDPFIASQLGKYR